MSEVRIDFKIISNKNKNVYCEGYVEIPHDDCEDEEIEWYYWTNNGYQQNGVFVWHDEEKITGLTDEQNYEIDTFKEDYMDDALWIDTAIKTANEDDNRTYVREFCTLIINDGAKMECEIKETPEYGDYWVELIPQFNGEKIDLVKYMKETFTDFDPWYVDDGRSCIENGKIYFEMSKDYWEGYAQDRLEDVNEEARGIYAMSLTRKMGIYSKYGEMMEQSMDDNNDDEWLFKMSQHENDTDEEIDAFLREEGFIDEELDY